MRMRPALAGWIMASLVALVMPAAAQVPTFIAIGTGAVSGVYYPTGGAICRLLNQTRPAHGIFCAVQSTGGSVDNLNALRAGDLEFAVAQSDIQHRALTGAPPFRGGPFEGLRSVFSVHAEPFTFVVRADSGISGLADLAGRRVNIGNPGSGQRATMETVIQALGLDFGDFAVAAEASGAPLIDAICAGRIDALVYTIGHPAGVLRAATDACDLRLLAVAGPEIDRLVAENPHYRKTVIPGGLYRGNPQEIPTFGVSAGLVATDALPEEIAYSVARTVLGNLDAFRGLHPALASLRADEMVGPGLGAPLHPGARRAFRELGLLE